MKLHKNLSPLKLQKMLFNAMLPNFLVTFIVFGAVFLGLGIYAGVFSLTIQYLVIFSPAILFITAFFSVIRFYKYVFINLRVLNSFSSFYKSFGEGASSIIVDFPEPILFWKGILKDAEEGKAKNFVYLMRAKSSRYEISIKCVVKGRRYKLWAEVVDWRDNVHVKETTGNYASLPLDMERLIDSIHTEVVKGRAKEKEFDLDEFREKLADVKQEIDVVPEEEKPEKAIEKKKVPEIDAGEYKKTILSKIALKKRAINSAISDLRELDKETIKSIEKRTGLIETIYRVIPTLWGGKRAQKGFTRKVDSLLEEKGFSTGELAEMEGIKTHVSLGYSLLAGESVSTIGAKEVKKVMMEMKKLKELKERTEFPILEDKLDEQIKRRDSILRRRKEEVFQWLLKEAEEKDFLHTEKKEEEKSFFEKLKASVGKQEKEPEEKKQLSEGVLRSLEDIGVDSETFLDYLSYHEEKLLEEKEIKVLIKEVRELKELKEKTESDFFSQKEEKEIERRRKILLRKKEELFNWLVQQVGEADISEENTKKELKEKLEDETFIEIKRLEVPLPEFVKLSKIETKKGLKQETIGEVVEEVKQLKDFKKRAKKDFFKNRVDKEIARRNQILDERVNELFDWLVKAVKESELTGTFSKEEAERELASEVICRMEELKLNPENLVKYLHLTGKTPEEIKKDNPWIIIEELSSLRKLLNKTESKLFKQRIQEKISQRENILDTKKKQIYEYLKEQATEMKEPSEEVIKEKLGKETLKQSKRLGFKIKSISKLTEFTKEEIEPSKKIGELISDLEELKKLEPEKKQEFFKKDIKNQIRKREKHLDERNLDFLKWLEEKVTKFSGELTKRKAKKLFRKTTFQQIKKIGLNPWNFVNFVKSTEKTKKKIKSEGVNNTIEDVTTLKQLRDSTPLQSFRKKIKQEIDRRESILKNKPDQVFDWLENKTKEAELKERPVEKEIKKALEPEVLNRTKEFGLKPRNFVLYVRLSEKNELKERPVKELIAEIKGLKKASENTKVKLLDQRAKKQIKKREKVFDKRKTDLLDWIIQTAVDSGLPQSVLDNKLVKMIKEAVGIDLKRIREVNPEKINEKVGEEAAKYLKKINLTPHSLAKIAKFVSEDLGTSPISKVSGEINSIKELKSKTDSKVLKEKSEHEIRRRQSEIDERQQEFFEWAVKEVIESGLPKEVTRKEAEETLKEEIVREAARIGIKPEKLVKYSKIAEGKTQKKNISQLVEEVSETEKPRKKLQAKKEKEKVSRAEELRKRLASKKEEKSRKKTKKSEKEAKEKTEKILKAFDDIIGYLEES